jgi:pimeloyl-ACP methyl ester carboxylesterase
MESFERAGLIFPVVDRGPVEGETVVLLHGFPQSPASWDDVVPLLHAAGLRTLVPAQRGYLPSARPQRRSEYRLSELVDDVVGLLDAAELDRVHLVGHDWGGGQAWATAAKHPDRLASLTTVSTPHPTAMVESFLSSTQGLRSWYVGFFQLPVLPELVAERTMAKSLRDSGLPDAYVAQYVAAMQVPGALTGALNWYRGMPFSLRQPVGPVDVPTTYVWGRHDFALGRAAAERTARYVRAAYEFVELDGGHWLPETEPVSVAEAIIRRAGAGVDPG